MKARRQAQPAQRTGRPLRQCSCRVSAPGPTGHTHGQVPSRCRPAVWPGTGPDGGAAVPGGSRSRTGSSPAMQALRRAQAAARYARRTGCGIDEASGVVAGQSAGPAGGEREGQGPGGRRAVQAPGPARRRGGRARRGRSRRRHRPAAARAAARPGPARRDCRLGPGRARLRLPALAAHRIRSEIYEYNPVRAGGRVYTLHGFFEAGSTPSSTASSSPASTPSRDGSRRASG